MLRFPGDCSKCTPCFTHVMYFKLRSCTVRWSSNRWLMGFEKNGTCRVRVGTFDLSRKNASFKPNVGAALRQRQELVSVSVSGSDELNYRGLAEITTKESFFTNTVARLSGASLKDGKLQFPFRIGGTIDSPVFCKGKGDKDVDAVQKPR